MRWLPRAALLVLLLAMAAAVRLEETVPEMDRSQQPILSLLDPVELERRPEPFPDDPPARFVVGRRAAVEARSDEALAQTRMPPRLQQFLDLLTPRPGAFDRGSVEGRPAPIDARFSLRSDVEKQPPPTRIVSSRTGRPMLFDRGSVEFMPKPANLTYLSDSTNELALEQGVPVGVLTNPSLSYKTPFFIAGHTDYKVVCYYGQRAIYRPEPMAFHPADMDSSGCTHLIYAFVGLDETSLEVKILDYDYDVIGGI